LEDRGTDKNKRENGRSKSPFCASHANSPRRKARDEICDGTACSRGKRENDRRSDFLPEIGGEAQKRGRERFSNPAINVGRIWASEGKRGERGFFGSEKSRAVGGRDGEASYQTRASFWMRFPWGETKSVARLKRVLSASAAIGGSL